MEKVQCLQLLGLVRSNVPSDYVGSSHCGLVVKSLTGIHEDVGLISGLAQWVKDPVLLWCGL